MVIALSPVQVKHLITRLKTYELKQNKVLKALTKKNNIVGRYYKCKLQNITYLVLGGEFTSNLCPNGSDTVQVVWPSKFSRSFIRTSFPFAT